GGKNQSEFLMSSTQNIAMLYLVLVLVPMELLIIKKSTLMSVFIFRFMVALGENLFQKSSLELSKAF
ncbi:hypothetical protein DTI30_27050, partial [Escherichia coli]|nr:hypothetical protein [Escherichia coli]